MKFFSVNITSEECILILTHLCIFILCLEVFSYNKLYRGDKEVCCKATIKLLQLECYLFNNCFWRSVGLKVTFFPY